MPFDPVYLVYGALFIGTLLLVEGTYYLIRDLREGEEQAVNRRMRMIAAGAGDTRAVLSKLRRDERDAASALLARLLPGLDRLMGHSGLSLTLARFTLLMAGLFLASAVGLRLATNLPNVAVAGLGALVGIVAPLVFLLRQRASRIRRFGEQLPDALDLIVRCLRAGHPISAALSMVAKEMPDPAGTQFGIVVDEMTYGLDLDEALENMTQRVPHSDLRFLIVAIQIQHAAGGNLAEILSNLATVIRARYSMFRKIRAISAEGRFSGLVVGALPFVVAAIVNLTAPTYFGEVLGDPLFVQMITFGLMLLVIGQVMIYRLVNFRV